MNISFYFIDISKRLPSTSSTSSTSSNSTTATHKRLKAKVVVSTVNQTRSMKGHKTKKQKTINESNKKSLNYSDSNNNNNNNNNNNSTKKIKQSTSHSRHIFPHPIIHHQKKSSSHTNQLDNIPSSSTITKTDHHIHHHHHVINNDHCDSCGELYGEMISCDTCPATFHLLCANPPLSREDVPKGSYFCENCRTKAAEEEILNKEKQTKIILQTQKTFLSDSKNKLQLNGFKKNPQRQSTLEQIKLPTGNIY
jgi:hypothetical protein